MEDSFLFRCALFFCIVRRYGSPLSRVAAVAARRKSVSRERVSAPRVRTRTSLCISDRCLTTKFGIGYGDDETSSD